MIIRVRVRVCLFYFRYRIAIQWKSNWCVWSIVSPSFTVSLLTNRKLSIAVRFCPLRAVSAITYMYPGRFIDLGTNMYLHLVRGTCRHRDPAANVAASQRCCPSRRTAVQSNDWCVEGSGNVIAIRVHLSACSFPLLRLNGWNGYWVTATKMKVDAKRSPRVVRSRWAIWYYELSCVIASYVGKLRDLARHAASRLRAFTR